jgi:hypothetical protein
MICRTSAVVAALFTASASLGVMTTYTFTGTVTQLGATGNVLGVQGVLGQPVTGSFSIDQSQAFITSTSGVQVSSLMGSATGITINVAGHSFTSSVYQATLAQQSSPGVNTLDVFPVGFNMSLDGVPNTTGPNTSSDLELAFASGAGFPVGTLPDLTTYPLDPLLSFGLLLESDFPSADNSIRFRIDSIVPAPGGTGLLATAGLLAARRRRLAG